jgi:hypothetical protein
MAAKIKKKRTHKLGNVPLLMLKILLSLLLLIVLEWSQAGRFASLRA